MEKFREKKPNNSIKLPEFVAGTVDPVDTSIP